MKSLKLILGTMTFSDQADESVSNTMISEFSDAGYTELDTAYDYNQGETELLLGNLIAENQRNKYFIASKANPWGEYGLQPNEVKRQVETSLSRLKTKYLDLLYLHAPDLNTPIEQTLKACWELHQQGKFKSFGLSNFSAWQVAEIAEICKQNSWMRPCVYQGMYNALTRDVEPELFPCLRNYNIQFYVYNPLAGGLLTGKHISFEQLPDSGRFATYEAYQDRYWKQDYLNVIEQFNSVCKDNNITPGNAALRWLRRHSMLSSEHGDGVILGASKVEHLNDNLQACLQGRLPDSVVTSLDNGWEVVRPTCISYFRT